MADTSRSWSSSQLQASTALRDFLQDRDKRLFVLQGYAGTGKTFMVRWLCEQAMQLQRPPLLMASTGRAARLLSDRAGLPATSVHRQIYRFDQWRLINRGEETAPSILTCFARRDCDLPEPLLIVDEASMISDRRSESETLRFGSGKLLSDLLEYADSVRGSQLVLVGDPAQLPPVNSSESPALATRYLAGLASGSPPSSAVLTEVFRQQRDNLILENATRLRQQIADRKLAQFALAEDGAQVRSVEPGQAVDHYRQCLSDQGVNGAVIITQTNRSAMLYNQALREKRWGHPTEPLLRGELLVVCRNAPQFDLANGDQVSVLEAHQAIESIRVPVRGAGPVDLVFQDIVLGTRATDGTLLQRSLKALLNLLDSSDTALTGPQMVALLVHFNRRHPRLKPGTPEYLLELGQDDYYNALWIKYGYAITAHKAQGGEWPSVVVDFDSHMQARGELFFRWTYTAISRASKELVLVNPPSFTPFQGLRMPGPRAAAKSSPALSESVDSPAQRQKPPARNGLADTGKVPGVNPQHQLLCEVIAARCLDEKLVLKEVREGQYFLQFLVTDGRAASRIKVHFNGKGDYTKLAWVRPAQRSQLDRRVWNLFGKSLQETSIGRLAEEEVDDATPDERRDELVAWVNEQLVVLGARVARVEHFPWRERLHLVHELETACFDFSYNAKGQWTAISEVSRYNKGGKLAAQAKELFLTILGSV